MKDKYATARADLMTGFMVRSRELAQANGIWAMINLPSWMALKSFEDLRRDMLHSQRIVSMVHLGRGVFGSDFGSVAFVMANSAKNDTPGIYRRLFEQHVEVRSVETIETLFLDETYNRFEVTQSDFTTIPGSPIVYWLTEKMRSAFHSGKQLGVIADIRHGLSTGKNEAVVRFWWEISADRFLPTCASLEEAGASGKPWFPYNSGGKFRRWYGNVEKVLRYDRVGRDLMNTFPGHRHDGRARYFQEGVTWSKVSSGVTAFRSQPVGQIFDVAGNSFFLDQPERLAYLLGFCNSSTAQSMLAALSPTLNFEAGQIARLPVKTGESPCVPGQVTELVATSREDWDEAETSWDFRGNPLVSVAIETDPF